MNFVAGNYLLNPRRHSYWWSRTIWINIRFIRFSVWAVKVSKIQIFKFYDKIVKAIIMGIFVANKTRQFDRSKIRVLTSQFSMTSPLLKIRNSGFFWAITIPKFRRTRVYMTFEGQNGTQTTSFHGTTPCLTCPALYDWQTTDANSIEFQFRASSYTSKGFRMALKCKKNST